MTVAYQMGGGAPLIRIMVERAAFVLKIGMRFSIAAFAALLFVPALLAESSAEKRLRELSVPFYFDLGPDSIDVRDYPKKRRKQYETFVRRCSGCHTLSRAINTPMRGKEEWEYYVYRMRLYSLSEKERRIQKAELEDVLSFLVYDSRIRKVKRGDDFEELDRRLRRKFRELHRERIKLLKRMLDPENGRVQ
jgi:hypothetical protein